MLIKVLPIQSKTEQELACARCGIPFEAELLAYQATVDEVFVGVCQFKLSAEGGIICDFASAKDYEGDLFEPLFVMGRGTLNFIDLCGVHNAFFDADFSDEGMIRAIGFTKNDNGRYEVNLVGFFDEPCKKNK